MQRQITIPEVFSVELAEDVGFHIGDGYMKKRIDSFGVHYDFVYAGNNPDDLRYFQDVLIPRKKSIFNLQNLKILNHKKKNALMLKFHSREIFLFYKNILEVQESPKINIKIPKWIFQSTELQAAVIRGLFDSDGNFKVVKKGYSMISFTSQSTFLAEDVKAILISLGIPVSCYKIQGIDKRTQKNYSKFCVQISGKKNIEKWMNSVGFSNPKHLEKYHNWKNKY